MRLAHAAGLLSGNLLLRQIGHAVTLITQLVLVVALLLEAF
ncbi:hypothetical protein E8F12_23640 [Pseudomonas sp. BN102]|nr:hypothetical protein [Pseudomonas sp. BN102]